MQDFSRLYEALDATTRTNAKVEAMVAHFPSVPPEDAAWAVFFLSGRRLKRLVSGRLLRAVGDARRPACRRGWSTTPTPRSATAPRRWRCWSTVATGPASRRCRCQRWLEERILALRDLTPEAQYAAVTGWWAELSRAQVFVLNKLLTGAFRVGVSQLLVVRALAEVAGLPRAVISHRLMGRWQPTGSWYRGLLAAAEAGDQSARPYPFFLASPLEQAADGLGPLDDWLVEWKWDGIRGQLIRRQGALHLWSRGEELITHRFPELAKAAAELPEGVVLDGEILAWDEAGVLPFAVLQRRIGRDQPGARILEQAPAAFVAYDLLEQAGTDLRALPLAERRARLEALIEPARGSAAAVAPGAGRGLGHPGCAPPRRPGQAGRRPDAQAAKLGLPDRAGARRLVEVEGRAPDRRRGPGLRPGRQRPAGRSVHRLHLRRLAGRGAGADRQGLFRARPKEIGALDQWIRANTIERFGPVRQVSPVQVFELAFEGIQPSSRHKAGLAVRFPRIPRWRTDKPAAEADRLETLQALLEPPEKVLGR